VTAFEDRLAAVDARLTRFREEAKVPAVAWGVIRDRELVHTAGAGTIRDGEDARPDADSVYRIASMTKSITAAAIEALVAAPNDPAAVWPAELERAADVDVASVERSLGAAAARFGRLRLGETTAGDGRTTATFDALGADGRAELAITVEPETGVVTACTMSVPERVAPIEGWQDG
jgi:hypothetical protein